MSKMDSISKLYLLQASSKNSVVSEQELSDLQKKVCIKSNLDEYLLDYSLDTINNQNSSLIILSGNAGDGKSMTLSNLKDCLKEKGISDELLVTNADATHTDTPTENLDDKLLDFFGQFLNDYQNDCTRVYIIAMNVGIAIKFFNSDIFVNKANKNDYFSFVKDFIFNELNIIHKENINSDSEFSRLKDNVLVVNFDLRCLVQPNLDGIQQDNISFFKNMINKIYDLVDINECNNCMKEECPIYFNLKAFQQKHVRNKVENILFKVFLYNKVHLTPRNVWDFLYLIITGGEHKFLEASNSKNISPCIFFSNLEKKEYDRFLFYNNLFEVESENAIIKYIRNNSINFDPLYLSHKRIELMKILAAANPTYFYNRIKKQKEDFIINGIDINKPIINIFNPEYNKNNDELINNICRFNYFFAKGDENDNPDILITSATQMVSKDFFLEFYNSLLKQKDKMLNNKSKELSANVRRKIRDVLVTTFGSTISGTDQKIIQIETVTTRSKGHLLAQIDIKVENDLFNTYNMNNVKVVESLDFFANYFIVKINKSYLKVTLDLYELINLASNGYNISSLDLERFKQLEILNKNLIPKLEKNNIYYEFEREYYRLKDDDIDVQFEKIT